MSTLKVNTITNLNQEAQFGPVLGTAQNSTSGTFLDFTGIPSWANRVTVMFKSVSTSGTSPLIVQAGTSGGVVTSGYTGGSYNPTAWATNTNGFLLSAQSSAVNLMSCIATLIKIDAANNWVFGSYAVGVGINTHATGGGNIALSGALDRVRITTSNGTDTFDAGSVNVMWE